MVGTIRQESTRYSLSSLYDWDVHATLTPPLDQDIKEQSTGFSGAGL
jgi:hypothetical protein